MSRTHCRVGHDLAEVGTTTSGRCKACHHRAVEAALESRAKNHTARLRERALERYPHLEQLISPDCPDSAWVEAISEREEIVPDVLRDVIRYTYKVKGAKGQRPLPDEKDVDMAKVWPAVFGNR